jgi:A/G-specific adenine glycosylase
MLRETARAVLDIHHGIFPHEEAELLKLPGIGPYTAAALRAFCFRQPSGLVDGNVSRIFARMAADPSPVDSSAVIRKHRDWALDLCDPGDPATYQHAIMELGQTICRPGRPACERCPIASFCACSEPEELPRKKPPAVISEIDEHALFCRDDEGLILLHQESGSRRNGMWKLPLRSPCECAALEEIYSASYMITRYRVSLRVFLLENSGGLEMRTGDRWVDPDAITALPFATPYRKALNRILENH